MRGLVSHTVNWSILRIQLRVRPRQSRKSWQRQCSLSRSNMQTCASTAGSSLQHLYEEALSTFSTKQQPQDMSGLEAISSALQQIPLQELGLQSKNGAEQTKRKGLFGGWSGSSGRSRVLYGELHVKSYDWNDEQSGTQSPQAHLVLDKVVDASSGPAAIFPSSGGNIHQFTAVTGCAVLDILAPPYSPQGGRDCTYYHTEPTDKANEVQLHVRHPAPYLNMKNVRYRGVQIQPMMSAQRS